MTTGEQTELALPDDKRLAKSWGHGLVIAGTGHRPEKCGGHGELARLRLVAFARAQLEDICERVTIARVISGMALGWDQALAEAACDLGVQVLAAIPCDGQDSTWPIMSRKRYADLLARPGVESHVVCPGPYKAWKMQVRNEWMVNRADILLALFDGSPGGTANCVAYFRKLHGSDKRLWNVWSEWEKWPR